MKDIRTEKLIFIAVIMDKYNYETNETIKRRINNYDFQANTNIMIVVSRNAQKRSDKPL